jgi:RNA polymerase sigma-70 factor, ECF subfamily
MRSYGVHRLEHSEDDLAGLDGLDDIHVPGAFDRFYRAEYRRVVAVIYGLTGSRWVAEDLAQDAFLRVHRDWARVEGMESPSGWVRRIAINLARSRFRRLGAEAAALLRLGPPDGVTMSPLPSEFDDFWREVRRLPDRQTQVLVLRYIDDLAVDQIAGVLGIAEGTVRALLHQGRERLKRQLEAKGLTDVL